MSTERSIGNVTSLNFVQGVDYMPGPVTLEECDALIKKIENMRWGFLCQRRGEEPNTLILSNRQWCALRRFATVGDTSRYIREPSLRGMKIIVDARGDYPNTPLVGHIEF